jgi:hypothetical protein
MISGGNFTGEVTRLGTPGNDTLNGMDVGSRFVSGLGNDGLKGGGGGLLMAARATIRSRSRRSISPFLMVAPASIP